MKVAIYLRVSTDDQNTANQLPDIGKLCAARPSATATKRRCRGRRRIDPNSSA
jgi:DNA invertase Pin-like site-specific DNA recombinase